MEILLKESLKVAQKPTSSVLSLFMSSHGNCITSDTGENLHSHFASFISVMVFSSQKKNVKK